MSVLYISGGMTDKPAFNFPMFDSAEVQFTAEGHKVYSPAAHDREVIQELYGPDAKPEDFPGYAEGDLSGYFDAVSHGGAFTLDNMLAWDFDVIVNFIDAIVMLPGWEASTGARWERIIAEAMNKVILIATCENGTWFLSSDIEQRRLTRLLKEAFSG